jgi:hypothetical protein
MVGKIGSQFFIFPYFSSGYHKKLFDNFAIWTAGVINKIRAIEIRDFGFRQIKTGIKLKGIIITYLFL